MAAKSNPKTAPPITLASSLIRPILSAVASSTFGTTATPGPPIAGTTPPPRTGQTPQSTIPRGPVLPNQANPVPIKFGSGSATVSLNSGSFARDNPRTKSVAGGGPGVTLSASAFPQEYWRNVEILETMMRGICIHAVQSMESLHFGRTSTPAVMGVLLALNEVKDGTRSVGKGWQVYIHSSVRGVPAGGPRAQAILHPTLKARIGRAKMVHHFSSMCAEMGLLSNFLYHNPTLLKLTGRLESCGQPVYMMTYQASDFPPRPDDPGPRERTGYYLVPCSHSIGDCGQRQKRFGTQGCKDVLALLGVEPIGPRQPSEQDRAVLAEQIARQNGTAA